MTTTTTQTRLIAPEGVLRPRPLLRTGFAQHVSAEPNYSLPDFEEPQESPRRVDWTGVAVFAASLIVSGATLWAIVRLAGLPL